MRRSFLAALLAVPALWLVPKTAAACTPIGNLPHTADPSMQAIDDQPPTLPPILEPAISRRNTEEGGCISDPKCSDPGGSLTFSVQASDDTTPREQIGYRFTLAAGTLPTDFALPPVGGILAPGSAIVLRWYEGDEQEAFDFTLAVTAIDRAGNASAPQTVRVQDPGSGGCRVGERRSSAGGTIAIVLLGMAIAAQRRRRRSR